MPNYKASATVARFKNIGNIVSNSKENEGTVVVTRRLDSTQKKQLDLSDNIRYITQIKKKRLTDVDASYTKADQEYISNFVNATPDVLNQELKRLQIELGSISKGVVL